MNFRLLLFTFLLTGVSLGQQAFGQGGYKVTGTIIDTETGSPLEYASVSLLDAADSALIDGGITDAQGKFSVKARPGKLIVEVQFISYASQYFTVQLSNNKKVADMGRVEISPDTETLKEVVVTGQKSQMVMELDKRVFNVGEDLTNAGGNAAEILDKIPSVTVDIEGNVSLRGSSNVRILVNGKPSGLVGISGSDALRQLQGNMVQRVEVITNPSARYEAQGNAGIINIILKKENDKGINGSFSANAGYPDNYGLSFNVNYRKKWMNLFANYGVSYRKSPGSGLSNEQFFNNNGDTTYRSTIRESTRGGISNNFRIGSDFYLNDKNTLTVSGMYRISDEGNDTELIYRNYDKNRILSAESLRTDNETEDEENMEYTVNWTKTFDKEKQKLTAEIQYRESSEVEESEQNEGVFPETGEPFEPNEFQQSLNDEYENNLLLQVDYEHPFAANGMFELGYRGNVRQIDNNYRVEELAESGEYEQIPGFSNHFLYDENIHAAYAILGNKTGRLSYQVGLRSEFTDLTTQLINAEKNHKNYVGFFPSAHITYELEKKNSFQASYSRRLDRPGFWSLNPFSNYTDPRSIRAGNPDLDPEYTDAYELGYLKNWKTGSLFTSVYYRHSTDVIDRVQYQDILNGDTVLFALPQNLSSRDSYGVEFTVSKDVDDWWNINGSTNFFRAITEGQFQDQDLSSDTYSMSARLTSKMTLFKVLDYQISGRYSAPREDTQGRRKAFYTIDMGFSKDVFSKKGTLTLNIRDLLNSMRWRSETYGNSFYREIDFQWRARQVSMSFTYRLNQNKKPERRNGGGDFDGGEGDF